MNLIEASGNEFIMGEQDSIIGHDDELPAHSIKFTYSWYMDKTEVTQKSYSELMSKTYATYTNPPWGPVDIPFIGRFNFPKGDDYPAYFVNWFDAALYCNARSKEEGLDTVYSYTSVSGIPGNDCVLQINGFDSVEILLTKLGYRLPTEAEWEYSCRAGSQTKYYWGDNPSGDYANGSDWDNSWPEDNYEYFAPVSQYLPNTFGLFDMSGNVIEWCNDMFDESYYDTCPDTDPRGSDIGRMWPILRGGAADFGAVGLRSAYRFYEDPGDNMDGRTGFRVVLPVSIPESWK